MHLVLERLLYSKYFSEFYLLADKAQWDRTCYIYANNNVYSKVGFCCFWDTSVVFFCALGASSGSKTKRMTAYRVVMNVSGIYVIVYYKTTRSLSERTIPFQVTYLGVLKFNSGRLKNYKSVVKLAVVGQ